MRKYAVPGIIAMTASSLYNMVDSIFIGHIEGVGAYAISGLAVTFPIMNLSTAFGTLVGVGASTLISILLGQKNIEKAGKVLSNVVTLNTIIGALLMVVMYAFLDKILYFFGASENTLPFAKDYISIIIGGNIITHLYFGLNTLIRASGHPTTAMGLTLFTVTANAILDPVFINVLGLGIKGAAIATILCQIIAFGYTMAFFLNKNHIVHFEKRIFSLDWTIAKQSLEIGMGPFLMNVAACIVALFINQQLRAYGGDLSIGAYGIVNRITMMFIMVCMGLSQGMQPIVGYNFGARSYSRVKEAFRRTAKWMCIVTGCCFLVSELIPDLCVKVFTNDPELIAKSSVALRKMNFGFALVGFGMASGNFFQSIGMVKKSIFLSLSRQLLFLVPLVYSLPLWFGEDGVWYSFPISDIASIIFSLIFVIDIRNKMRKLKDGDDPAVLGGSL